MRVLISGAAGFLASHLTDLLLAQGHEIVGLDNFITGKEQNIAHFKDHKNYKFHKADVIDPVKIDGPVDRIYHMASPASPIGYVKHQIATVKVNSQGTWNLLELSLEKKARFLMASTSEAYGDPAINPQREDYWGNVNPIGLRSMYDEPKRFSEACTMAYHRERGADTRIIRIFNTYGPRIGPLRRPGRHQFHPPGAQQRTTHRLRRRETNPIALLCDGPGARDQLGDGERFHRADQPRQPRGSHHPSNRQGHPRVDSRKQKHDHAPPHAAG